ncbi:MAG TPA: Hsp70 family protein [Mycobacterium sp.]
MSDPLGLSIGTTNLVAARVGAPPLLRRAVTMSAGGMPITGFVERVGDPVPLVAADGSQHRAESLLAQALAVMVQADGAAPSDITVARPAYWGSAAVAALREATRAVPALSPNGFGPTMISDATAAVAALAVDPGLPTDGIVALVDFGASGTSFSLFDAGADFTAVGETLRYNEFSGEAIDQLLLTHVVSGLSTLDPAATAAVESLTRLREDCRRAKELLSSQSTAEVVVELPAQHGRVRLTRSELEAQIADLLTGAVGSLREMLIRNGIAPARVAAVATVGGVASIPAITQRLSEEMRVPVVTTPRPELNAAAGAAVHSARVSGAEAPTAAGGGAVLAPATDEFGSSTYRALAWSEDDRVDDEPVPYVGEDYSFLDRLRGLRWSSLRRLSQRRLGGTEGPWRLSGWRLCCRSWQSAQSRTH